MSSYPGKSRPGVRESARVRRLVWVLGLSAAAALGAVCTYATLQPPSVELSGSGELTVTVVEATVGRSVPYVVRGVWPTSPAGVGASEGVVTTLDVDDADVIASGSVVYTVGLRPVVVATGVVPSFRDLSDGSTGRDVSQLQALLRETGHLSVPAREGVVDDVTTTAVRSWQRSLGVEADGVVRVGDVIYLPTLPARAVVVDEITVGSRVSDGQVVIEVLADQPELSITVPLDQVEQVSSGALVVTLGDDTVEAVVASSRVTETGDVVLVLSAPDGGLLCGERCGEVPRDPTVATYRAERVVVPSVTGAAVPTSAVQTAGDGATFVTSPQGERLPVEVQAQGDGLTVLEGVAVGAEVRLVGSDE